MQNPILSRAIRSALVAGAIGATALPLSAQAADSAAPRQLGQVTVVGSHIKRTDIETAQATLRIDRQTIENSGLGSIEQILQRVSSNGGTLNLFNNQAGNSQFTGGGEANINLRYLGTNRTLILVNGHRWITGLDGSVDLHTIPLSVVDHIEILMNGASAIYGSDAIAGVVNIVTLKNFNGAKASAYYGKYNQSGSWDGTQQKYNFVIGRTGDKYGTYLATSYVQQDPIHAGDRPYATRLFPGRGSSGTPRGRFVFIPAKGSAVAKSGLCPVSEFENFSAPLCNLTVKPGTDGSELSDYKQFTTADRFNFNPYNYLLTPQQRFSFFARGHYDFTPNVSFFSELLYTNRQSDQQGAATPLFFATSSLQMSIPADQRYNPFGFDLSTDHNVDLGYTYTGGDMEGEPVSSPNLQLLGRRMLERGPRSFTENVDTSLYHGGFNGNFMFGSRVWDWDATYTYSRTTEIDINHARFSIPLLTQALGGPAVCTNDCVPLNLFGGQGADGNGSITQQQLDYVGYVEQDTTINNLRIYHVGLSSSDVADLPAGPLGVAVGYQYREHDGLFRPGAIATKGNNSFSPGIRLNPTHGRISVDSFYGELSVPILANLPGVRSLDLDLAARRSDYSTFGSNTTESAGLKYEPFHDLLLRATWASAFRAPSLNELYAGKKNFSAGVTDPCSNYENSGVGAKVVAACKAAGVPGSYTQPNAQINIVQGGNPNLGPETSISRTVGFVYSPSQLPGFSVNADYYKIELDNTIQPRGGQAIVDACYKVGSPSACARIDRATFGSIQTLNDTQTNLGGTLTEGFDYGFAYNWHAGAAGDFRFSLNGSHINTFKTFVDDPTGGTITTEFAGQNLDGEPPMPADRARLGVDWNYGNWSVFYSLDYIGGLLTPCTDSFDGTPISLTSLGICSNPNLQNNSRSTNHIDAVLYHNVQVGYNFASLNTNVSFGVRNLFNKKPPSAGMNAFYATLYMDLVGRYPYLQVSTRF